MKIEWAEEFSYNAEKYAGRHDIVCRGFFRVLEDLYREGFLTKEPINADVKVAEGKDGWVSFNFEFGSKG